MTETRNQAEQIIYLAEKSLKDAGDKISQEIKTAVNQKIESLKSVKDGDNIEAIKTAVAELSMELQKIGQAMYNKKQEPGSEGE